MAKRLHKVEQEFLDTIKNSKLIEPGDKIVVGVSGGPDSTTLLTCLYKYKDRFKCEIIVAHINHLIRKDSTDDEKYVENLCKKINLKFYKKRVEVEKLAKEEKRSTEEMGTVIRYKFFDEVAEKEGANKIAIAHNMNDNAETMLLNLIRGTGLSGLEGIKSLEYNKYIRPLINCERKYIEDYCDINDLNPRIDSTNKENIYKRNIIRNKIIPLIEELNPNIVQTLKRTSNIVVENNRYIDNEAEKVYNRIAKVEENKVTLSIKEINNLQVIIKSRVIIIAINQIQGDTKNIDNSNINEVLKLIEKNVGNKFILLNKNVKVEINKGRVIISKQELHF